MAALVIITACSRLTEDNLQKVHGGMSTAQVEAVLGRPSSIEQSETPDQTMTGEVDHFQGPGGEGRVVYVNHVVFKAEFVPTTKS